MHVDRFGPTLLCHALPGHKYVHWLAQPATEMPRKAYPDHIRSTSSRIGDSCGNRAAAALTSWASLRKTPLPSFAWPTRHGLVGIRTHRKSVKGYFPVIKPHTSYPPPQKVLPHLVESKTSKRNKQITRAPACKRLQSLFSLLCSSLPLFHSYSLPFLPFICFSSCSYFSSCPPIISRGA